MVINRYIFILKYQALILVFSCLSSFPMANLLWQAEPYVEKAVEAAYAVLGFKSILDNAPDYPTNDSTNTSYVDYQSIRLVDDHNNLSTGRIFENPNSYTDQIVEKMLHDKPSNISATDIETSSVSYSPHSTETMNATSDYGVSSSIVAQNETTILAAEINDLVAPVSEPLSSPVEVSGIESTNRDFNFSYENVYNNDSHAVDYPAYPDSVDYDAVSRMPDDYAQKRASGMSEPLTQQVALTIFEQLMSPSNNLKALAIQLKALSNSPDVTGIWASISDPDLRGKIRTEFKNFFYANKDFNIINSSDKREELFNILSPAIKATFGGNQKAYLDYLYAKRALPGYHLAHDYETGEADFQDRFFDAGSWIYSATNKLLYGLEPEQNMPEKINNCPFILNLKKVEILCREGKFSEALAFIEAFKDSYKKLDYDEKIDLESKYKVLLNVYDASLNKSLEKAAQAAEAQLNKNDPVAVENSASNDTISNQFEENNNAVLNEEVKIDITAEIKEFLDAPEQVIIDIANKADSSEQQNSVNNNQITGSQGSGGLNPEDPEKNKNSEKLAEPEITKKFEGQLTQDKDYMDCLERIKEIKKEVPDLKVKDHINIDADIQALDREASQLYEQVRADKVDIEKVSENLRIEKKWVERVKEHVFYNKHNLDEGLNRFAPDKNIAESWERLVNNSFGKGDLEWFMHEFAESKLTENFPELTNRELHTYVDGIHNWRCELFH